MKGSSTTIRAVATSLLKIGSLAGLAAVSAITVLGLHAGAGYTALPGGTAVPIATPNSKEAHRLLALTSPTYDLALDSTHNVIWFAVMEMNQGGTLNRLALDSGQVARWPIPGTTSNGFTARIALGPDGSVWLEADYEVVRFDSLSETFKTVTLSLSDADASPGAADGSAPSPGTWPTSIVVRSDGDAIVSRHNVHSLTVFDSNLDEVARIPLATQSPADIADVHGDIYVTPYGGGPVEVLHEDGVAVGQVAGDFSRVVPSPDGVLAVGASGATRLSGVSAASGPSQSGSPEDLGADLGADGMVVYNDGLGSLSVFDSTGHIADAITFPGIPVNEIGPAGKTVQVSVRERVVALATAAGRSVWYATLEDPGIWVVTPSF
jgi:hypothetical protein